MKASSLGLAAVLAVVAFNSASAGVVRFRPSFVTPTPFARAHANPRAAFRSEPVETHDFRHDRRGFWPVFPAFFPVSPPPTDGDASTFDNGTTAFSAPSYSTTIVIASAAPQYAYAPAPTAAFASGGPKIITIGAPARSSRWRKMPIVVYGSAPLGGNY